MSDMRSVIESGNLDLIPEAVRSYVRTSMVFSTIMNPRHSVRDVLLECIDVANDQTLGLVIQVCIGICPEGILACYLSTRDEISWKVADALYQASNIQEEKEIVDYHAQPMGIRRLLYLQKSDV